MKKLSRDFKDIYKILISSIFFLILKINSIIDKN